MAHQSGPNGNVSIGDETIHLRSFLFNCLDRDFSTEIASLIESCVSAGAQLLMPDIKDRVEVLLQVLPDSADELISMSRGKRAQLEIILKSLEKNDGLPTLLNITSMEQNPICSNFLQSLLKSWEKLTGLRHLTHPLLQKVILFMAAAGKKRVSYYLFLVYRKFSFSNMML